MERGPNGIEAKTKKYARKLGCYVRKFNSESNPGVPDDVFITPSGVVFFIEFKSSGKKPTHKQEYNLNEILDRKGFAFVCDNLYEPGVDLWQKDFHHQLEIWHDGYVLVDKMLKVNLFSV